MRAWLMDAYRAHNTIVLWLKTAEKNVRIERHFRTSIYAKAEPIIHRFLTEHRMQYFSRKKTTYFGHTEDVYEIPLPSQMFEYSVKLIEQETRYRAILYDADISPEQMFLYKHKLLPFSQVEVGHTIRQVCEEPIPLTTCNIQMTGQKPGAYITSLVIDGETIEGPERETLVRFAEKFRKKDPDVISMDYAFSRLPHLAERLKAHNIPCPLNRWDDKPLAYKGGKTFYTYGQVRYQDYPVRLNGRFLLDTTTAIGSVCSVDGIVELCQLSGTRFQQLASRSFGAVFQTSLIRRLVEKNYLVPFKEKPIDPPLTLHELLKADRAGHTLDPKTGFSTQVAEIDFTSMFPWLIYNHNISPEMILKPEHPLKKVPGIPVSISQHKKGIIPETIKPYLDRRLAYKKQPTPVNLAKAQGLKWVLVTSYGYLRHREFKLGIATSHMAVCAYARETLIAAKQLAEEQGYEVIHGIVDSLYIKKKGMQEQDVLNFCNELEHSTGIPVSFGGIFKWVVFRPSINNQHRPLPSSYYGVFQSGEIKARGIEVRQHNTCLAVKHFQQEALNALSTCDTKDAITKKTQELCTLLHQHAHRLPTRSAALLAITIRIGRTAYKNNIPQRAILMDLQRKGIAMQPGQIIRYVMQKDRAVLPEAYNGQPDMHYYKKQLVRALHSLLQPFGLKRERLAAMASCELQKKLTDYGPWTIHKYIPLHGTHAEYKGLAERKIKQRLIKEGWSVWRGGLISITRRQEVYPNVRRSYERLCTLIQQKLPGLLNRLQLMCEVHHGMPDFICYRNGAFKFVECKLGYEQLSRRQKQCIQALNTLGMTVEVHKLVHGPTKIRDARVNIQTNEKHILSYQKGIQAFK